MDNKVMERAKTFIYNNARLLDRRRFEYFFEGGSKEAVISALTAYQNVDGGFGNALEPDIRCPYSQPIATEVALLVMDELECFDRDIILGIARYLKSITVPTGGFPSELPELNEYPHAPWWGNKKELSANINPTGRIMGLLLKQNVASDFYHEEWFQQSLQYVWGYMDDKQLEGYHDGVQWITFLEHVPDRQRAEAIMKAKLDPVLGQPETIERNANAEGYVQKVLDWAPSRGSYTAKFISEKEFEVHLSHLLTNQLEDGGWPISWPEVSPGAWMEWRGWITVDRLKTLKAFGRL